MNHTRLLPLILLTFACSGGDKNDDSAEPNPTGELQVSGDLQSPELAELCTQYASVGVDGAVTLNPEDEQNLESVACLSSVGGDLVIESDTVQEIILPNLTEIGSDLIVEALDAAEVLDMSALMSVGGNINIVSNPNLQIASWQEICDAGGSIVIRENQLLETLNIPMLSTIGSVIAEGRSTGELLTGFDVSENDSLVTLTVPSLTLVEGGLMLDQNDRLVSVEMNAIETVKGNLQVSNSDVLISVSMSNLGKVEGSLVFEFNSQLGGSSTGLPVDLSQLGTVYGTLRLKQLPRYGNIVFANLSEITGEIDISGIGRVLEDPGAIQFPSLATVGGDITFHDTKKISRIALSNLTTFEHNMFFDENQNLIDIVVAENATWNGNVYIRNNADLPSLSGLSNLTEIGASIRIMNNPALVDVSGLTNLGSLRMNDSFQVKEDECPSMNISLWICGSENITVEDVCEIVENIENEENEENQHGGTMYLYSGADGGHLCPETECPDESFAMTTSMCEMDYGSD